MFIGLSRKFPGNFRVFSGFFSPAWLVWVRRGISNLGGSDSKREQMEFKRRTEIFVETKRQLVIQQPGVPEPIFCPECGQAMLTAESAAAFFQVNRRLVYQLIESDATHFLETDTGLVMLCFATLEAVFGTNQPKTLPSADGDETQRKQNETTLSRRRDHE
jgi:hypothetical protein